MMTQDGPGTRVENEAGVGVKKGAMLVMTAEETLKGMLQSKAGMIMKSALPHEIGMKASTERGHIEGRMQKSLAMKDLENQRLLYEA